MVENWKILYIGTKLYDQPAAETERELEIENKTQLHTIN